MKFRNKVVLITGGSSGIGKSAVEMFLREGAKVVAIDKNNKSFIGKTKRHKNLYIIKADVSKEVQVLKAVTLSLKKFKHINILVNNAGTYLKKSILFLPLVEWNNILAINLTSQFLFSKYVLRHMVSRRSGVIINISSTEALTGEEGSSAYCASKGGIISLTKSLAKEFTQFGIRINCIAPGPILTPLLKKWNTLQDLVYMMKNNPLGRIGKPVDVARVILYLARERDRFITGKTIVI